MRIHTQKGGPVFSNISKEELTVIFPSGVKTIPHSGMDRCCLNKTEVQSIPTGAGWTPIVWGAEVYDIGGMHSLISNQERSNIKTSGRHRIHYKIRIEANDKFLYQTRIFSNNIGEVPNSLSIKTGSKNSSTLTITGEIPDMDFTLGDYLVLEANHDDNFAKDIIVDGSFFFCAKLF